MGNQSEKNKKLLCDSIYVEKEIVSKIYILVCGTTKDVVFVVVVVVVAAVAVAITVVVVVAVAVVAVAVVVIVVVVSSQEEKTTHTIEKKIFQILNFYM